jgi:Protein of unknown function (DUF2530)
VDPAEDLSSGPTPPPVLEPLHVDTARVVMIGTGIWMLALLVTLVVPGLHDGSRDWWPWAALSGAVLGLLGLVYVRRGRGNAASQ